MHNHVGKQTAGAAMRRRVSFEAPIIAARCGKCQVREDFPAVRRESVIQR